MKLLVLVLCVTLLGVCDINVASAEETLDTLLPPPSYLRRNADELGIDAKTKQIIERLYQEKEPKYHQLKYKVERLSSQLFATLTGDELDEDAIVKCMKDLLEAEAELKLYQVHVRISLLSRVSLKQRHAVQELVKDEPPATNWRGGIAGKVERIRELSKRVSASGASVRKVEKRMVEVDELFASGRVVEGVEMLDQVISDLEKSLGQ